MVNGITPGSSGTSQPRAAIRSRSRRKSSTRKNSWAIANSAPALILRARLSASDSRSGERGWPAGNAATPVQNGPSERTSVTSSSAYRMPCGCATQSAAGPAGGSPRIARMLRTPTAAYQPITLRSSATEWSTAVRWAIGTSVVSCAILAVVRTVRSLVEPPAP